MGGVDGWMDGCWGDGWIVRDELSEVWSEVEWYKE